MHPPKISVFDVAAGVNIDNKGIERIVDCYRVAPFGLYMSREIVNRPTARWIESWLLPDLGLCVSDWQWNPGHERDQDFYLDICTIERDGDRWRLTDHYLDVVINTGRQATVIDVDEFVAAVAAGLVDAETAEAALHATHAAVAGLAGNGYDLDAWLVGFGIALTWRRPRRADR